MMKKIGLTVGVLAATVVLGFGLYHTDASQVEPELSTDEIKDFVSKQYPGKITEIELDKEFNKKVYEVEVEGEKKEYEIKIDANSGEVLQINEKTLKKAEKKTETKNNLVVKEKKDTKKQDKKEKETKQENKTEKQKETRQKNKTEKQKETKQENKSEKQKKQTSNKNKNKKTVIDRDEASRIALNQFSGTIEEIELDEDDGRLIYEIEIEANDKDAEIEIDAYTGEVLVIEIDD